MKLLRLSAALALAPGLLVAQQQAGSPASAAASARDAVIFQLADAERKFVQLAEATPAEKYSWRPADGVRSIGEVFAHVAAANYMIPARFMGTPAAANVPQNIERTVTAKADIIQQLRASFAYARSAAQALPESEMGAAITLFGQSSTKLGAAVVLATHAHEHLGQSIAYARTNGIVPPWSGGGN